jgi:hypothetical protein
MNLPLLLRSWTTWLVAAEVLIVACLGVAGWRLAISRQVTSQAAAPGPPGPVARRPPTSRPALLPTPRTSATSVPTAAAPTPPSPTDPIFLGREMDDLNRVEAAFEKVEWRVTSAVAGAIESYLEHVVLPSIERSERATR